MKCSAGKLLLPFQEVWLLRTVTVTYTLACPGPAYFTSAVLACNRNRQAGVCCSLYVVQCHDQSSLE